MADEFINNLEIEISRIVEDLTREVIDHIRTMSLAELLGEEDRPSATVETEAPSPERPRRGPGRPRRVREPQENAQEASEESSPSSGAESTPRSDPEPQPTPGLFAARTPVAPLPQIGPSFAERRRVEEAARMKNALVELIGQNPGADAKTAAEKLRAPLGEVQKHLDDLVFSGALKMTSGHHGRCYHKSE